ncbi:MAG TPA: hypothetical protein VKH37_13980 [Ferruginibacter sp.]|nr:hypothetical protein [Ferruginibacter sp.]
MEDKLQEVELKTKKNTTFIKWSFRFFVGLIFLTILLYSRIEISPIFCLLIFVLGSVCFISGVINNEEKTYQFWISLIGYPLYLMVAITVSVFLFSR